MTVFAIRERIAAGDRDEVIDGVFHPSVLNEHLLEIGIHPNTAIRYRILQESCWGHPPRRQDLTCERRRPGKWLRPLSSAVRDRAPLRSWGMGAAVRYRPGEW
jgi:hypothetical protein